jgi:hypothetical protein
MDPTVVAKYEELVSVKKGRKREGEDILTLSSTPTPPAAATASPSSDTLANPYPKGRFALSLQAYQSMARGLPVMTNARTDYLTPKPRAQVKQEGDRSQRQRIEGDGFSQKKEDTILRVLTSQLMVLPEADVMGVAAMYRATRTTPPVDYISWVRKAAKEGAVRQDEKVVEFTKPEHGFNPRKLYIALDKLQLAFKERSRPGGVVKAVSRLFRTLQLNLGEKRTMEILDRFFF